MSENSTAATDLTSQYTAQVANDLERNVKEQERVTAEIAELQQQLTVLQHDHTILVNMQQALGLAPAPAEPVAAPTETPASGTTPDTATVPAPRGKGGTGTERTKRARKTAARTTPGKQTGRTSPAGAAKAAKPRPKNPEAGSRASRGAGSDGPKLVELVQRHLSEQGEPRSAAEVADALGKAHPDRAIRTTVVRSTLEGLVARERAQRTKQGSSVFYTTPDTAGPAPKGDDATS